MEKKISRSGSLTKARVFALLCLIVCTLAFIFSCMRSVLPLGAGIVGTFGVAIYPVLVLLALLSLAKFLGFSYRRSLKATLLMIAFIFSILFIIHCIRTFKSLDAVINGKTFASYLGVSYEKLTVLGSFGSIFCAILSLPFGGFGTIVVFGILATLMIGLFIDFELYGKYEDKHIRKIKSKKIREKVNKSEENAENGVPNYSFSEASNLDRNYTEADVAGEISTEIPDEYEDNFNNLGYSSLDVADEVEENVAKFEDPNYLNYNNIDQSYNNINFYSGQDNYANNGFVQNGYNENNNFTQNDSYNAVNEEVNQAYSGAPNFSNNVYTENEYPDVFNDNMDEYRRKFLHDTFGGSTINYSNENNSNFNTDKINENTITVGYSDVVEQKKPETNNIFTQNTENFAEKPQNSYASANISGASRFNSNNTDYSFEKPEEFNSFSIENKEDKEKKSDNFSNTNFSFPGMIGSTIDEVSGKSKGDTNLSSKFDDFDDEDDIDAGNNIVYGLDFENKISDIMNSSEGDEDKSSLNFDETETEFKNKNRMVEPKNELTDFSFLRKDDEDDFLKISEDLVKKDINTTSKFKEPLYSENSVKSTNDSLVITSVNPVEPPKIRVQAKEPELQVKKFSYNLGMNGIRYNPPPLSLLTPGKPDKGDYTEEQQRKSSMLEESLKAFNVPAKVVNIIRGPKITRYELSVPLGVPVKKIPMYELDIKRALAAKTINIQAPIPGSSYVGIELENDTFTSVSERELLESEAFQNCKDPLPIAVGKDISGEIVVKSLAKMVHLLIAGSTGSGKSVFIHSIVMSLIYKHSPEELRLIMIDPKKVEFNRYNGLPHLLTPEVVMGSEKAINALKWCVKEMDRRYDLMSKSGYNNIEPYNKSELVKAGQFEKFPYIVIIVDELAEIMMANKKEVEACIQRITQLARACGMHLILATQRPSVDIISGVIKNNVPSRIAFSLSSGIDSKTILNTVGAEKLLGQGDMLFSPNGTASMPRLQAAYCSDEEIKAVIDYDKQNNTANYDDAVESVINAEPQNEGEYAGQVNDAPAPKELDSYFKTALKLVMQNGGASTSYLQRRLSIGYSRAAKIMDQMEDRGYIAPATGSKIRKVLITPDEFRDEFGEDYNDINDV